MDNPASLRLFFGLELPEPVKQRLLSVQRSVANARWQGADQLHLTLVFLGRVSAQQLPELRRAARDLPVTPFDLTVSGIGCFGQPERPKTLWAGVEPGERPAELHEALNHRLAACGFAQEKRRFRPHITLARFKRNPGSVSCLLESHSDFHADSFLVNRVALYQSTQGSKGSVYTILDRFALN